MIQISFIEEVPEGISLWGVPLYSDGGDEELSPLVKKALQSKPHHRTVELFTAEGRFVVVRLGTAAASTRQSREEAGAALFKNAADGTEETLLLDIRKVGAAGLDLVVGILLACWRFDQYRTVWKAEEVRCLRRCVVLCQDHHELESAFQRLHPAIEGVLFARALTSEPPNVLYPMAYAERLQELASYGIVVEILDEAQLKAIGMTALLAVGQGSMHASAVALLQWQGASAEIPPVAIVGKGVCFDSGGVCLKSTAHQQEMKWDKAGAGVVAGLLKALAIARAPVNVVGILGLVENMPDGSSFKPGDILHTMSGQTIEIVDTDAEGRLVIADCLWYAQERFHPSALIDLGTLTIETFITLGTVYAGLYSTDPHLATALKAAGIRSGDLLWELPMGPYFAQQIASSVADVKNCGTDLSGENGAAAEFLRRFVKAGVPWAHIDIAGVSWTKEDLPLCHKGVTGFGVRLLENFLYNL